MKIYTVQSEANPKKKYRVWRFDDGEFACECPGYAFSKEEDYECKHILKIKERLKGKNVKRKKKS